MMRRYISLVRPLNCVMASIAVFTGALVAGFQHDSLLPVLLGILVAGITVASGNAANDFFDREVDAVSHPQRPLCRGDLNPRNAALFAAAGFTCAISLSARINSISLLIAVTAVAFLLFYEVLAKKTFFKNFFISFLTALLFLFGGAVAGNLESVLPLTLLAFFAMLGREIAKDIADMKGDALFRKTLPIIAGVSNAKMLSASSTVCAVMLSPMPYVSGLSVSTHYFYLVTIADIFFIASVIVLYSSAERCARIAKGAMFISLFAFLAGVTV